MVSNGRSIPSGVFLHRLTERDLRESRSAAEKVRTLLERFDAERARRTRIVSGEPLDPRSPHR
jgi:hypothetical protein